MMKLAQNLFDSPTRMAHSAGFAKRIRFTRPGRRIATGFGILVTAGCLVFSSTTIAQAAAKSSKHAPTVAEVRLRTGAVLKLAYINQSDDAGPAWHPDGSPATNDDLNSFKDLDMGSFTLDGGELAPKRLVTFNFLISDLHCKPGDNDTPVYRIKGHKDASYLGGVGQYLDDRARNRDRWAIPAGVDTVDLNCYIASKPFETVAHGRVKDFNSNNHMFSVRIPRSLKEKDLRVTAYDPSGNPLQSSARKKIGAYHGGEIWQYECETMPNRENVVGYELQARDFEHVTLTGIRLQPYPNP